VQVGSAVHVRAPKTKAGARTVVCDSGTVAVLRHHSLVQSAERRAWGRASALSGYVFQRENGTALVPSSLSRRFSTLVAHAGLPPIKFHALRHTSASLALSAGVAMKVVSDRLGHSTTGITADLYTHVAPALALDAADAIAASVASSREDQQVIS